MDLKKLIVIIAIIGILIWLIFYMKEDEEKAAEQQEEAAEQAAEEAKKVEAAQNAAERKSQIETIVENFIKTEKKHLWAPTSQQASWWEPFASINKSDWQNYVKPAFAEYGRYYADILKYCRDGSCKRHQYKYWSTSGTGIYRVQFDKIRDKLFERMDW